MGNNDAASSATVKPSRALAPRLLHALTGGLGRFASKGATSPALGPASGKAPRSILRTADGPLRPRIQRGRVRWRTVLTGTSAVSDFERREAATRELERRERAERLAKYSKIARLPALTYEEMLIPVRVALPELVIYQPAAVALDVIVDLFELLWLAQAVLRQRRAVRDAAAAGAAPAPPLDVKAIARDVIVVVALHVSRAVYFATGSTAAWRWVQLVRCVRVRELVAFVADINNDLSTNTKFLAVYKFTLVLVSVPHWVACGWWLIAREWSAETLELPIWAAQLELLTGNRELNPHLVGPFHWYLMSLYMAWAGMTAMGYGSITLSTQVEILYSAAVTPVQMVFYAFVLGTLFHYLVRADETTTRHREDLKMVDEYAETRQLPPALAARIRDHFTFQHAKAASSISRVVSQMPISLRTEVAVAQYSRETASTWLFHFCSAQFHNQIALALLERYALPSERLWKRGDGATELLWCVGGALHVTKQGEHIATVRSDLGPGQLVGEVAFLVGIPQPYTVSATAHSEVTLVVLSARSWEELVHTYPEQAEQATHNLLHRYALDSRGADAADAAGVDRSTMDEDELREHDALRAAIRAAIVERNEDAFAQMAMAVRQGDTEAVRALATRGGFDLATASYDRRTTLHLAVLEGNPAVVRLLVELQADVHAQDRFGTSAMEMAVVGRHASMAEELARGGAVLRIERPATHMHAAAKRGDVAHLALLLEHGVDVNSSNHDSRTALHVAATGGDVRTTEFLLENLADVSARDRWGCTALDDAVRSRHVLAARVLVRARATPSTRLLGQWLREACTHGDDERVSELLDLGAPIDAADYDGRTPLMLAVQAGATGVVFRLIAGLANVSLADRWGRPPLVQALGARSHAVQSEIGPLLAHAGAALPPASSARAQRDGQELLHARLGAAREVDMLALRDAVQERARERESERERALASVHDVGTSLKRAAQAARLLTREHHALYRLLSRHAERWIGAYGVEDRYDDEESEDGIDDADDDARLRELEHDDDGSADGSDDSGSRAELRGGESGAAVRGGGAGAAGLKGRAASHPGSVRHAFIRLVLQLPSAEAGLVHLQDLFARRLAMETRAHMARASRRKAERGALRTLLREDLGVDDDKAIEMADEVDARLPAGAYISSGGFVALLASPLFLDHFQKLHDAHSSGATDSHPSTPPRATADEIGATRWRKTRPNGSTFSGLLSRKHPGSSGRASHGGGSRANGLSAVAAIVAAASDEEVGAPVSVTPSPSNGSPLAGVRRSPIAARMKRELSSTPSGGALGALGSPPAPSLDLSAAWSGPGGAAAGGEPGAHAARVAEAVHVISQLFSVFDTRERGYIRPRDVHTLEGSLGEMGKTEIKQLFAHVITAARALGAPRESQTRASHMRASVQLASSSADDALSRAKSEALSASRAGSNARPDSVADDEADERGAQPPHPAGPAASGGAAAVAPGALAAAAVEAAPGHDEAEAEGGLVAIDQPRRHGVFRSGASGGSVDTSDGSPLFASLRMSKAAQPPADEAPARSAPRLERAAAGAPAAASAPTAPIKHSDSQEPSTATEETDEVGELAALLGVEHASDAHDPADLEPLAPREQHRRRESAALQALMLGRLPADAATRESQTMDGADAVPERKLPGRITRHQFHVGVAAWILASRAPGGAHDGAADAPSADEGAGERSRPPTPPALKLSALTAHTARQARTSTESAAREADEPAAAAVDEPPAREGARPTTAEDASTLAQLTATLGSAAACAALAEAIVQRLETRRLDEEVAVDAAALLGVMHHPIVLPESTRPEHVRRWCKETLGLSLDGADAHASDAPRSVDELPATESGVWHDDGASGDAEAVVTWKAITAKLRAEAQRLRTNGAAGGARTGRLGFDALGSRFGRLARAGAPGGAAVGAGVAADAVASRPWYVLSCRSPISHWLHRCFLVFTVFDACLVPLQLAFFDDTQHMGWIHGVGFALDGFYVLRMGVCFVTTYVNDNSVEVVEPRELRRHYRDTHFTLDLLASWPHDVLAYALGAHTLVYSSLRLTRLINVRYAWAAFLRWHSRLSDTDLAGGLLVNLSVILYVSHLCACGWNVMGYSPYARSLTAVTWADEYEMLASKVGGNYPPEYASHEARMIDHYLISMNSVISMLSALGLSQLPANFGEMVFYVGVLVLNMTVYAWAVGGVSGLVMKQDDAIVAKRAQLELAHTYIAHIRVPSELKARLRKFFTQRLQSASLSQLQADAIYTALPMALQVEVSAHTNRALVANCALLRGCSGGFLDRVSSSLRERLLDAEVEVHRQGEACKELLLIASGEVEAYAEAEDDGAEPSEQPLDVLGPGDTVGAVSFIFGIRHVRSARVSRGSAAKVFVLSREAYRAVIKLFPAEEDRVMDSAFAQFDGEAAQTARTGRSSARLPSERSSDPSAGRLTSRSEGTHVSGAASHAGETGLRSAHNVLAAAKEKRQQLQHARLCTAAVKGDVDAVRRLLSASAVEVNSADFDGRTALHLAACGGSAPVVTLLLAHKADARAEDRRGSTALDDALSGAHADVAALLSAHGARQGASDLSDRLCSAAVRADDSAELRQLCVYGVDINTVSRFRRTALHVAASQGHVENARMLIEHRADVNIVDARDATPLTNAVNFGRGECVELLLGHGARFAPGFDAASALCSAAATNDAAMMRLLLRAQCDVNAADAHRRTALHLAASSSAVDCLLLLLREPALDVSAEDQFGATALDDAEREEDGLEPVMGSLLRRQGAARGSAQPLQDSPARRQRVDQQRAREQRAVKSRETLAVRARLVAAWVEREREAVASIKKQAESAAALERARGAVLSDERPEFWAALYAFTEGHTLWQRQAVRAVQPALRLWGEQARDAAGAALDRMAKLIEAMLNEHHEHGARVLERLNETTFRTRPTGAPRADEPPQPI